MIRTWAQLKILLGGERSTRGNRKDMSSGTSLFTLVRDLIDSLQTIIRNIGGTINVAQIITTGETPLTMEDTVWDDIRAPFTQTKRGALDKPDFDYTNIGLLFPQNDDAEIVYIIFQIPHNYKLGTNIYPHIHWQQMNANNVVWKMEYKWFNPGGLVPGGFTAATATTRRYTWAAGNLHQYDGWTAISGAGITEISSMFLVKVFRDDNVDAGAGSGDALAFEYDIHYEIDTLGSKREFIK